MILMFATDPGWAAVPALARLLSPGYPAGQCGHGIRAQCSGEASRLRGITACQQDRQHGEESWPPRVLRWVTGLNNYIDDLNTLPTKLIFILHFRRRKRAYFSIKWPKQYKRNRHFTCGVPQGTIMFLVLVFICV